MILYLLDLSTDFDTIDHDTFLARMGIHSKVLNWFKSYLICSGQSVFVSGAISASRHLSFCFPQGYVTGPNGFSSYADPVLKLLNNTVFLYTFMQMTLSTTFLSSFVAGLNISICGLLGERRSETGVHVSKWFSCGF